MFTQDETLIFKATPPRLSLSTGEVLAFTQELSHLLQAGLPLFQALSILCKQQTQPGLKKLLPFLAGRIYAGFSLSSSLAYYRTSFSPVYLSLVQAGEHSGKLAEQLHYVVRYLKHLHKTRQALQTALIYPALVLGCMGAVSLFLLLYVVPRFESLLHTSLGKGPLPLLTHGLLGCSHTLQDHGKALGAGVLLVAILVYLVFRHKGQSIGSYMWYIPGLRSLGLKLNLARFTHILVITLHSGLSLIKSLSLARPALTLASLQVAGAHLEQHMQKGMTLSEALKREAAFPPAFLSLVEIGEATGSLATILESLGESYQDQVEQALKKLSILLEPTCIIALSCLVGLVVLGLFLPILQLMQVLG